MSIAQTLPRHAGSRGPRAPHLGLMPKVLLVFVPAFLVLTLLSTRMLVDYGRGQARDALAARVGALSGRVAIAVGAGRMFVANLGSLTITGFPVAPGGGA